MSENLQIEKAGKRLVGSVVVAVLLALLAWIDGSRLQESGQIIIGRERQILEGTSALAFVWTAAGAAVGCTLYAALQARILLRARKHGK